MLTPNRFVSAIDDALAVSAPTETSTVGGSAETEVNAVIVIPHGRPPTRDVTTTTPLASDVIASTKSSVCVEGIGFSVVDMVSPGVTGVVAAARATTTALVALVRRHVHRDGNTVRDHVEHGRTLRGTLDDLAQLLLGRVAREAEGDADSLEAVAVVVRQPERALHVHVALERRLDLGQVHSARGGDVHQRRRQAGGQRVQQVLRGIGAGIRADQDRGLARVDDELLRSRRVLLVRRVEVADRGAVVRPVDPPVPCAELELRERRVVLDGVERPVELRGVDAVADLGLNDGAHDSSCGWGLSTGIRLLHLTTPRLRRGWSTGKGAVRPLIRASRSSVRPVRGHDSPQAAEPCGRGGGCASILASPATCARCSRSAPTLVVSPLGAQGADDRVDEMWIHVLLLSSRLFAPVQRAAVATHPWLP